jgi:hypothetical protein
MSEFVKQLRLKPDFHAMSGADSEQVKKAEQALGLRFSADYREYLSAFGVASFDGHELTGICDFPRLNVVDVTIEQRAFGTDIPADLYVIEQANIDGIVIWQSGTGEVYQSMPNMPPAKWHDSLREYLG